MTCINEEPTTNNKDPICHLEDLTIVWLDATIDSNNFIWLKRQSLLRNYINYIRTFVEKNECVKYICTIHDERIFLIVSGSMGEIILPEVHHFPQISDIYIFCYDINKHEQWSKSYGKIRGIFNDENCLLKCLEKDVKICSNALLPISIVQFNERSFQDINEEQVKFIWFHLMIEVISHLPQNSRSKKQMINECRTHYAGNSIQLSLIEDFHTKYNQNLAINWYTKDCFLYKLLNKAFRTENIDIIFNYHYFLSDLIKELTRLYHNQYDNKTGTLTVYHGQHMHIEELQKIQNSIGHLMSINTFFSTTTNCIVAAEFSGNGERRSEGLESVIFQIEIDLSIQRRPFAKIQEFSNSKDENEILFSMGTIYRIENVELYTDNIWLIILKLTDEVKKEIEDLFKYFIKHIGPQPSLLELGVLLSKIGDFERAKRFYSHLLDELPEYHYDLGVLYNNLGEIYRQQGYLDSAMNYYILAIDQLIKSFGFIHPWFACIHSNIAKIFFSRGQFDHALVSYQCALLIIEQCREFCEQELFSTIYYGMALTFQRQEKFEMALEFYEKALEIEGNILPSSDPSIAITYNGIGKFYFQMKDYSKALENLLKALPIMSSTLPDNHYELIDLYGMIGAIYDKLNENPKSIEYLLKAEEIIDRSILTSDHTLREFIYRILAAVSYKNKMIDLSIRMHHKLIGVYIAQIPSNQYEIAHWTSHLGDIFADQGDHQQSFEYLKSALDIVQQLPRTIKNKYLYNDIINSLRRINHISIAIEHYIRLIDEETNKGSSFAGKLYNNLGAAYSSIDNEDLALTHYRKALQCCLDESNAPIAEIAIIYYNIGNILHDLPNCEDARFNFCKALEMLREDQYELRSRCHYHLGQFCENTNDLVQARKHFDLAIDLIKQEKNPTRAYLQRVLRKIENNSSTNFKLIQKSNED